MKTLRTGLQSAVSVGPGTADFCLATLTWGGVYGAVAFVQHAAATGTLPSYLKGLRPLLNVNALTTAPLTPASVQRFDAGMTKIHSVFDSHWTPIYDSRVGAAIAMLFELYYADDKAAARIAGLAFPSGAARGKQIRDPGHFPSFAHAPQFHTPAVPPHVWAQYQLKLAWVIEALLTRYPALFAGHGTFAARAHAFEATLFMLGYDLRCFTPTMRCLGLPIDAPLDAASPQVAPPRPPRGLTWVPTGISMPQAANLFLDYATTRLFTDLSSGDFVTWQTQERSPAVAPGYAPANATILRPIEFDLCEPTEAEIRCICGGGEAGLLAAMARRGAPVDERERVCLVAALLYGAMKGRGLHRQQMVAALLENDIAFSEESASTLLNVGSSVGKFFGLLDADGAPTHFYTTFFADPDYQDLLSELLPLCEAPVIIDPLPPINLAAIEQFVGYGTIDAPVVFVGVEEALADVDQRRAGLVVRSDFQQTMDVQQAHAAGLPHEARLFHAENPLSQPTWRPICDLLLRREPGDFPFDAQERRHAVLQYQAMHLGRIPGSSLLTELLPLPHKSTRNWWYNDIYPALTTRAEYEAFMLPRRTTLLGRTLALHPRELIVCYGKSHRPGFLALIEQFRASLELVPGDIHWEQIPLQNPDTGQVWNVERTIIGQTNVILANHLTRMPLSSHWGLDALADVLDY